LRFRRSRENPGSYTGCVKFIEPMLLLQTDTLPQGWLYEIKIDGYRALAGRSGDRILFRSRRDNDFSRKFPSIAKALRTLLDETLIDGEVAALDEQGRPSFNLLQNYQSAKGTLVYFVFDLLIFKGEILVDKPLDERKALLEGQIVPKLQAPLCYMEPVEGRMEDIIRAVKAHGLEWLVAKRRDSKYEPGKRSGAWRKMRVNKSQPFVIGGYTVGGSTFDAVVFGYYENGKLLYASRSRNGFTPVSRADLIRKMKPLEVKQCPFANLPQAKEGRWGAGLAAVKMKDCVWLKPQLVGEFEYAEWTGDGHLRHSSFLGLVNKKVKDVKREG
jgi:DNA ligase D-like protein (predicted ligase)